MESTFDSSRSAFSERRTEERTPGIDKLSKSAHQAVDRAASMADRATTAATSAADRAASAATAAVGQLAGQGEAWMETTRSYVKEHPFAALGVAAAAGFVLSLLTVRWPR
jgi:ElaB/YqjD/DUF883 family membrane-anchored ribosome-binding protein